MKKSARIFVIIDNSMIWEAYSDIPIKLVIQNNDKQWFRKLEVVVDKSRVDEAEKLINDMDGAKVELEGLKEEQAKHSTIRRMNKKK